jgi:hypothetical protein
LPDPRLAGARQAPSEDRLQELARYILEERERRQWHFPRAVFDEIPWEILLLLYASDSGSLSKAALVDAMLAAPELVDRWTDYLEREGLLERLRDLQGAPALKLTPGGLSSLELYLFDRLIRSGALELARTEAGEARLPGWAVGLLMLGTALVSGAMAWSLAGA